MARSGLGMVGHGQWWKDEGRHNEDEGKHGNLPVHGNGDGKEG